VRSVLWSAHAVIAQTVGGGLTRYHFEIPDMADAPLRSGINLGRTAL
jgi:hypothetical protein